MKINYLMQLQTVKKEKKKKQSKMQYKKKEVFKIKKPSHLSKRKTT